MLILDKSFESIQKKCEEKLMQYGISNTPGSIARLFSSIINSEQAEFYETLTVYHMQCFVSTATGDFLDKIGNLLSCERLYSESDDDYRYRIVNQTLTMSNANYTAIRLAALSVKNVQDIKIEKFTSGIGSFTIYVLNNNVTQEIIDYVVEAVNKVVGFGIRFEVSSPVISDVEISIKLMFDKLVNDSVKDDIKLLVKKAINDYVNGLGIGQEIIVNELTEIIMKQNDSIMNYSLLDFKINGESVLHTNQYCDSTGKFLISKKPYAITVY